MAQLLIHPVVPHLQMLWFERALLWDLPPMVPMPAKGAQYSHPSYVQLQFLFDVFTNVEQLPPPFLHIFHNIFVFFWGELPLSTTVLVLSLPHLSFQIPVPFAQHSSHSVHSLGSSPPCS